MATTEPRTPPKDRAILSTWVPLSVARELRLRASRADRSVSAEVRRAINFHLQREDGSP